MSKRKNVERKNIENAKMSLLTSNDFCWYYFSRIFFRILLKSFRRLANSFSPTDYCMNEYSTTLNRRRKGEGIPFASSSHSTWSNCWTVYRYLLGRKNNFYLDDEHLAFSNSFSTLLLVINVFFFFFYWNRINIF